MAKSVVLQDELLGLQEREEPRNPANQIDLSTVYRAGETLQVRVACDTFKACGDRSV